LPLTNTLAYFNVEEKKLLASATDFGSRQEASGPHRPLADHQRRPDRHLPSEFWL